MHLICSISQELTLICNYSPIGSLERRFNTCRLDEWFNLTTAENKVGSMCERVDSSVVCEVTRLAAIAVPASTNTHTHVNISLYILVSLKSPQRQANKQNICIRKCETDSLLCLCVLCVLGRIFHKSFLQFLTNDLKPLGYTTWLRRVKVICWDC